MKYLWIMLAMLAAPAYAETLTPEIVEKEILIHSPRSAKSMYFKCDDPTGYGHIAQGTKQWLGVAVQLVPYVSGCEAELLNDAFARALLAAPPNVIMYVNSQPALNASKICLPKFAADESKEKRTAYLSELEGKLKRITDEQLKGKVDACLAQIDAARAKL